MPFLILDICFYIFPFSAVDEIVLNYVLGILEGLSSHGDMEDSEEVEQFAEMMEAYLPGFALISM